MSQEGAVRVSMLVHEFTLTDLDPVLAVGSLVLLVSVAAVRLAVRSGLPSLLLYLAIGIVIGEAGFGIQFESTTLTQVLGYSALVLILAEGGLTTSWSGIRDSVAPAAVLSTLGVLVSVGVVSVAGHYCPARVVDDRAAHRRGAVLHRRRGGVLRAAPGAAAAPGHRDARGRVRASTTPPWCCWW